jgi:hypothetical protein
VAVVLVDVSAKLLRPFPVTSAVTSTSVQVPAVTRPDDPATEPIAGLFV